MFELLPLLFVEGLRFLVNYRGHGGLGDYVRNGYSRRKIIKTLAKQEKHHENANCRKKTVCRNTLGVLSEYLRNGHFDFYIFSLKVLTRGLSTNTLYHFKTNFRGLRLGIILETKTK